FASHSTDPSADTAIFELPGLSSSRLRHDATDSAKRPRHMACELVGDVALVTLRTPDLSEEAVLTAVRAELEDILEGSGQRRVIVRLGRVKVLSKGAVVMFLARAQHLAQHGGTMRFSDVSPPIMAFLSKTQLPLLIETYPTLDEAMDAPWDS
ncbi:MAG: STAS domain-containing protein, partial [Solirubrobacterales bacterium]